MSDAVTYTAALDTPRAVVDHLTALLARHRHRLGTRPGRRALSAFEQAVLVLRWLREAVRVANLARDNSIGLSTCYRHLHEALNVIAAQAPNLRSVLLAVHTAGHDHVNIDGTLIATNRVAAPGPTDRKSDASPAGRRKKVDLWWSGKHHRHGGNVQVLTAPDGWPVWVSAARPGREHDTTCARTHPDLLPALEEFTAAGHQVLADLGYEGEASRMTVPVKKAKG